jgi:sulfur carrier protein ThiS
VPSSRRERVKVYLAGSDGRDSVEILEAVQGGEE